MSKVNDFEEAMEEIFTEIDREQEYKNRQIDRLMHENESLRRKNNILTGYITLISISVLVVSIISLTLNL